MKSNLSLVILSIMVITTLVSCKKKIENCKLGKSYVSDGSSTPNSNTFAYYGNGKLKSIQYSNTERDTLVYLADTLTILHFDYRDSLMSVFLGLTNGNGLVTTGSKSNFDFNGNLTSTEYFVHEYNTEGQLTKQTISNAFGTAILSVSYAGGNSSSANLYNGATLEKKYFFFHSQAANKTGLDDMNSVFTPYFGTPSFNLLDSTHIVLVSTNDTVKIKYEHTFDANDYVSKTVETYLTPGLQTKYHTYQYFDCSE